MPIHWYPGHMHKANKEMLAVLPRVDVVVEVLDARLPYSSANPSIAKLCEQKPTLKVFSKADLADEIITAEWQQHYQTRTNTAETAVAMVETGLRKQSVTTEVLHKLKQLVPHKGVAGKSILAMITGIPNVGKSTLINALAGRQIAKTGNEPAVTKAQQRIKIDEHINLLDTPGILWPKIYNENSGYRLATTGAIKDTAMSNDDVAYFAAEFLMAHYPERLQTRFGLDTLAASPIDVLEQLGRRRGALGSGGHIDFEKISKILLTDIRDGSLGGLTFETPEIMQQEELQVAEKIAEREAKQQTKKTKKRRKR